MKPDYIIPNWQGVNEKISAYTTTRNGGVSKTYYESFNLAEHVGDDVDAVSANRARLKNDLSLPNDPYWLTQIHSDKVICLDSHIIDFTGDAVYCTKPNLVCVVMTADCLPILFTNKDGTLVGAIHAGWQGLAKGIIESTLNAVQKNTNLADLVVWFGPAIGPKTCVVKNDVRQKFLVHDSLAAEAFYPFGEEAWLMNIYTLARQRFMAYGITNIYGGDFCTYAESDKFFSYRRDHQVTGRMASLIWISA